MAAPDDREDGRAFPDGELLRGMTVQDELLQAEFDPKALEKARSLVASFKQFIEDHKDEIEAIQVLYSRPYRAGLRYKHVKDLAAAIQRPPLSAQPVRLWQAFHVVGFALILLGVWLAARKA